MHLLKTLLGFFNRGISDIFAQLPKTPMFNAFRKVVKVVRIQRLFHYFLSQ